MKKYYLAIDIGASSGRHILSSFENGKLILEEVYRFENKSYFKDNSMYWDSENLFSSVVEGLKKCKELRKIPTTMAIDTWGVDYVLLDENDNLLSEMFCYRDSRTEKTLILAEEIIDFPSLYKRVGIQKQPYNTIYQLLAEDKDKLNHAKTLLMVPQYLNFLLTGTKQAEYTLATTTALVSADDCKWDLDLIAKLGLPTNIFPEIVMPKTIAGKVKASIEAEIGYPLTVVNCASHDTASAFLAVPAKDETSVYISSGTWSLLGVENTKAITNTTSMEANFTNEGGFDYRFRYLKNIMGLWILQSIRHNLDDKYSFPQLISMADRNFKGTIDVNDLAFLNPSNMIDAVKSKCNIKIDTIEEVLQCVYQSLANSYRDSIKELESLTNIKYTNINIVGGGCQDSYLNQLTAKTTGLPVYAGPVEGTALGNILVQMMADGEIDTIENARKIIENSFEIKHFSKEI